MTEHSKAHFVFKPIIRGMAISESDELFPVGKVYCVGKNYADHAKEMGAEVDQDRPFFFSKPPQAITQLASIPFPTQTDDLHHEVELVVFLRSECSNIPSGEASQHIFGYAVGVDLTRRDLQAVAKKMVSLGTLARGLIIPHRSRKFTKKKDPLYMKVKFHLKLTGKTNNLAT